MLEEAQRRARERAAEGAGRGADVLNEELARFAWDAVEEYFPEEARQRRRRRRLRSFAIGLAVGLLARQALKWWSGD